MKTPCRRSFGSPFTFLIATLAALSSTAQSAPPATWDLSRDFSASTNPSGVWSYGYKTAISGEFGLNLVRETVPLGNGVPLEVWSYQHSALPQIWCNATSNDAVLGELVYPPGALYLIAGFNGSPQTFGAIRLTVPNGGDGEYLLESSVRSYLEGAGGGDTDYHVVRNGQELFGKFLAGDARSGYTNQLTLSAGDIVDFLVGRGADGNVWGSGLVLAAQLYSMSPGSNAPSILEQPLDALVVEHGAATFNVHALGSAPLTYQWRFEGEPIPEATGSSLALLNVQLSQAGVYSVVVSNAQGQAVSSNAVLTVQTAPPPATWDLSRDFSVSANPSGVWSYGYKTAINGEFGLNLVRETVPLGNGVPLEVWSYQHSALPQIWCNATSNDAVSGQLVYPAGTLYLIAGFNGRPQTFGAIRLTVPNGADGEYLLESSVRSYLEGAGGGDTDYHVVRNGQELFGKFLAGDTRSGYTNQLTLSTGDIVDFLVGRGADGDVWGSGLVLAAKLYFLNGGSNAPSILKQPEAVAATVGDQAALSVQAAGTPPLRYQWRKEGQDIPGATSSSLVFQALVVEDRGDYRVVVSNDHGAVTSDVATLQVALPPTLIRVPPFAAKSGGLIELPIEVHANGSENALGFSLEFDPTVWDYSESALPGTLPSGASLFANTNELASGRLGLAIGLPSGITLPAQAQPLVLVTLGVRPLGSALVTTIAFADRPTIRQVASALAIPLPARYVSGTATLDRAEFEADLAPRPSGDASLGIVDWVQAGRFVAGLDIVTAGEFQRADCAPRSQSGNGILSVADWVQVGRYGAGLDPATAVGGPSAPSGPPGEGGGGLLTGGRRLVLQSFIAAPGEVLTMPVRLESGRNENALGFSLGFDSSKLRFLGVTLGAGVPQANLNVNSNLASAGQLGVAVALPTGKSFPPDVGEILKLSFAVETTTIGNAVLTFTDMPVVREVVDAYAAPLLCEYSMGVITVSTAPRLAARRSGGNLVLAWPSSAAGFALFSTHAIEGNTWNPVQITPVEIQGQQVVVLSIEGPQQWFTLVKP